MRCLVKYYCSLLILVSYVSGHGQQVLIHNPYCSSDLRFQDFSFFVSCRLLLEGLVQQVDQTIQLHSDLQVLVMH